MGGMHKLHEWQLEFFYKKDYIIIKQ